MCGIVGVRSLAVLFSIGEHERATGEDNANVNGQIKASSVFFKRAKFAPFGWLLGSLGVKVKAKNDVFARDKGSILVLDSAEDSSSRN